MQMADSTPDLTIRLLAPVFWAPDRANPPTPRDKEHFVARLIADEMARHNFVDKRH